MTVGVDSGGGGTGCGIGVTKNVDSLLSLSAVLSVTLLGLLERDLLLRNLVLELGVSLLSTTGNLGEKRVRLYKWVFWMVLTAEALFSCAAVSSCLCWTFSSLCSILSCFLSALCSDFKAFWWSWEVSCQCKPLVNQFRLTFSALCSSFSSLKFLQLETIHHRHGSLLLQLFFRLFQLLLFIFLFLFGVLFFGPVDEIVSCTLLIDLALHSHSLDGIR